MARRKDHSPEELKLLIRQSAEKIIETNGLRGLTARALAKAVSYTPGTIYNVYKDMDALVIDINYATLGRLQGFCLDRIKRKLPGFPKIQALAYAYVDFARENMCAWETLFSSARKSDKKNRIPKYYQERLEEIFHLIENTLKESLKIPSNEAARTARVLWACLHGMTVLTLDGRLNLIGVDRPHRMIDDLLKKYFDQ